MSDDSPVLVTGFGPFHQHKVNASWEAVKEMASMGLEHEGKKVNLEIREVPVVYETVSKDIPLLWAELAPKICVHVGVSPYTCIKLEKYGRNLGYNHQDINSCTPVDGVCCKDGPDVIQTKFDVENVARKVCERQPDVVVQVSEDAGRYLCDFIYYTSLNLGHAPVIFVHVPPLDKPYSKLQLATSLKNIIELLLQHENK